MKKTKLLLTTLAMSVVLSHTALAGSWHPHDNGQWKYQNDDGSFATGWITDNDKSYFLDANGIMLSSTLTPDDYYVGADGASGKDININYSENTYQEVLDAYTAKLKAATPVLEAEYKSEAQNNNRGINGLAELHNSKLEILAQIQSNGISKMAELWFNSSSGSYDEYLDWSSKLFDIYMEEGELLFDTYLKSAS